MIFGFIKEDIRKRKLARRKKHLRELISRLAERKAILDIERDMVEKEINKTREDLKNVMKREGQHE